MTDIINSEDENVRTVQTNATCTISLANNENKDMLLPALLVNGQINLNFILNDEPVTADIEGSLIVTAQYLNSPVVTLATLDLSTDYSYTISGKYTQLNFALSGLSGADTVIVYADQNINM